MLHNNYQAIMQAEEVGTVYPKLLTQYLIRYFNFPKTTNQENNRWYPKQVIQIIYQDS